MKLEINKIKEYENYLICEEKSSATIEKYVRDIRAFAAWLQDRELTKTEALAYKASLTEKYAPATVNSVLASLNGFFMYMEWFQLKIKNLKIQKRLFCQPEKELSKSEYESLLKASKDKKHERINLIMQTICSTGIRVSELKFITVEAVTAGQTTVRLKGKIRTILLPKELCKLLKQYISKQKITSGMVFVTRTGKAVLRPIIDKNKYNAELSLILMLCVSAK